MQVRVDGWGSGFASGKVGDTRVSPEAWLHSHVAAVATAPQHTLSVTRRYLAKPRHGAHIAKGTSRARADALSGSCRAAALEIRLQTVGVGARVRVTTRA